ncbi:SMP-30/gluconolactonase/LRE family protein [Flavilitoribacter nigricans]|uniref:Superoxide dismutase n=1 Tax=Flavilitoribacter nigricans (strain ATCC 23147 / DSM 23189 / NBRC 102662 / NCIMB 1420 / SS-2) TaxID=1122177 RepID=A0A2D0NC79_FLAN2|nr:superoxide dismutase [Flavilitoribacter nigricans]PHN06114.1 superoxide dismutase [Flavilitoribacter nigricans DSM 23189 = NBRC 102662]
MQHKTIFPFLLLALLFSACQRDSLNETALTTTDATTLENRQSYPDLIPLPDGFKPEGIVAGTGSDFYVGSLADGSIYRGDFRTGSGEVFYTPDGANTAVGMSFDSRTKYLFVAGGGFGTGYIVDTRTGTEVVSYDFGGAFVNDVIVTKDAAYFTDSFTPYIYKVPLGPTGSPADAADVEAIELGGDFEFVPGNFNANGIEAIPDGTALIVVNGGTGDLYLVDPETGDATLIDLNGDSVNNGDGILLVGKTLYVVQNFLNQIAEVKLSTDYLTGSVEDILTDDDFRIPTTVTRHGGTLYAVNARFDVAPPQSSAEGIEFNVVRVD